MEFEQVLRQAQAGDQEAFETIFHMFEHLMRKLSYIQGRFNEDLYQELSLTLFQCVKTFRV